MVAQKVYHTKLIQMEVYRMKTAVITGITGQDGAYLAALLLEKGYRVVGTYRRTSTLDLWRLHYLDIETKLILESMDLEDLPSQIRILEKYAPDEIYNFAAQSFVGISFEQPLLTGSVTGLGVANLLEAIRITKSRARFYQASTSEMFGRSTAIPQTETTPFNPCSPYGAAKLYAHCMTVNYRESYGMYACSGITFNHESPLRGIEFVTRKITDAVARIKVGKLDKLVLGNLDAQRDWGYAKEYVVAMWLMLQQGEPRDFMIASGTSYSVRDFVAFAFQAAGLGSWTHYVETSEQFERPTDIGLLIGNPAKVKQTLGWSARTSLEELVYMMVQADLERHGYRSAKLTLSV